MIARRLAWDCPSTSPGNARNTASAFDSYGHARLSGRLGLASDHTNPTQQSPSGSKFLYDFTSYRFLM